LSEATLHKEKELFTRIAAGDEAAFGELFHAYNRSLLPFIIKLTGSSETAKEVVQDIFLSLWQQREKLRGVENPRGWIIRIASNMSVNYLRKQALNGKLLNKLKTSLPVQPTAENEITAKELAALVQQVVGNLPPGQRKIYELSREQGMSIPEIAESLHVSPSTVKNQLVSALRSIREAISKGIRLLFYFF
jgi:RNA polymerase sigma-70 factor (family 1)